VECKNIIFDLGGVIIDLSVDKTVQKFAELAGKAPKEILNAYQQYPDFHAYEKGELSDQQFREALRRIFSLHHSDHELDAAWNAMLVDLPQAKLELLDKLKEKYTVSVLSNTNNIHLDYVNEKMLPRVSSRLSLNEYFHFHYYSHLVNKRKPEAEIFVQVLQERSFDPAETLFLDDNPDNVTAAKALGIQTLLVGHPRQVLEFFDRL
jgi:glucose-1-phosphatase